MGNGIYPTVAELSSTLACGQKTIAKAAAPDSLVGVPTPCLGVWIGAPEDGEGTATNTKTAYIGDANGQYIPLLASDFKGFFFKVSDAALVRIKVGADGEAVNYMIVQ